MVSLPVFVCAVVLTLRLFVYSSLFLCVRILFVYAVHTRGPKQFNTTHITYTVQTVDQEGKHIIIIEIIAFFNLYRVNIN